MNEIVNYYWNSCKNGFVRVLNRIVESVPSLGLGPPVGRKRAHSVAFSSASESEKRRRILEGNNIIKYNNELLKSELKLKLLMTDQEMSDKFFTLGQVRDSHY